VKVEIPDLPMLCACSRAVPTRTGGQDWDGDLDPCGVGWGNRSSTARPSGVL
jgi:hypothetical protein